MLQSFGLSWVDITVLSFPDYFESNSFAYVRAERTFLVRKTKEFLVFVVKFMHFSFFIEAKRGLRGSSYVLTHENLSDVIFK